MGRTSTATAARPRDAETKLARSLGPTHRYRTATGIEEEDINQIFPETS